MALMYDTTMSPSKMELLAAWLPTRPWFRGDATQLAKVASYRVDDPAGEVGLEGHLVTAGDSTVYHVPLSYRGAPLPEGEEFLLDTTAHGVLGTRWISDGVGDPVYRTVIAEVMAHGGGSAEEFLATPDGGEVPITPRSQLRGSGSPEQAVPEMWAATIADLDGVSIAETGFATLRVQHVLDAAALAGEALGAGHGFPDPQFALRITWPGQAAPVTIATLTTVEPQ